MKKYQFCSSFIMKVAALSFMAIDHLGEILNIYFKIGEKTNALFPLYLTMIIIGRLALPLFCFMIAQGMLHTKSYQRYALRLGIMALLISIVLCVCEYASGLKMEGLAEEGNIFIDLLLGSLAIYCLQNKNNSVKLLCLIPLGISIASFIAKGLEMSFHGEQYWYPKFLRGQYDWLAVGLIILFYLAKPLTKLYFENQEKSSGISYEYIENTPADQTAYNLISLLFLFVITVIYYLGKYVAPLWLYNDPTVQIAMIGAGVFIVCYNGSRGYNAKWFQYGSYLFYPLHILVLYGLVALFSLI